MMKIVYYLISGSRSPMASKPIACSIKPIFTKINFKLFTFSLLQRDDKRNADLICNFFIELCIALKRTEYPSFMSMYVRDIGCPRTMPIFSV